MPMQKRSNKPSFKVFADEDLMNRIDEVIQQENYNGRGEYALFLIRRDLAERDHKKMVDKEHELLEEHKKREKK